MIKVLLNKTIPIFMPKPNFNYIAEKIRGCKQKYIQSLPESPCSVKVSVDCFFAKKRLSLKNCLNKRNLDCFGKSKKAHFYVQVHNFVCILLMGFLGFREKTVIFKKVPVEHVFFSFLEPALRGFLILFQYL